MVSQLRGEIPKGSRPLDDRAIVGVNEWNRLKYSRFLKRWVEKFDPEQAWLLGSGATPPDLKYRFAWQHVGYSQHS